MKTLEKYTLANFIGLSLILGIILTGCGDRKNYYIQHVTNVQEVPQEQQNVHVYIAPEGSTVRVEYINDIGEVVEKTGEIVKINDDSLTIYVGEDNKDYLILYENIIDYEVLSVPGIEEQPPEETSPEDDNYIKKHCLYPLNWVHRIWFLRAYKLCLKLGGEVKVKITIKHSKVRIVFLCRNAFYEK